MSITLLAINPVDIQSVPWSADWFWSLPIIVLTVVIHVLVLGVISERAIHVSNHMGKLRYRTGVFAMIMGTASLLATCLHALEAGIWACAYYQLGALADMKSSMLYSLNAITSYGHANLTLQEHWHLMGAIEALNGWLLFGLTTAFLFGMIEKVTVAVGRSR